MDIKVSIIVPVYNVENYLHRCIDSILKQTFTDFELILVDDGTLDRSGGINNYAWDKLYRKELLKNIMFPEGKYFEDIFTMYKLFSISNKVVHIKSPKYHYLIREDSILGTNNCNKVYDFYLAWVKCLEQIKDMYPQISKFCNEQLLRKLHIC